MPLTKNPENFTSEKIIESLVSRYSQCISKYMRHNKISKSYYNKFLPVFNKVAVRSLGSKAMKVNG